MEGKKHKNIWWLLIKEGENRMETGIEARFS